MKESKATLSELAATARAMRDRGEGIEDILEALRNKSPSITQSIKTMRDVLSVPLQEAKHLVHYSRTWSDMRDPIAELHEHAESIAEDYGSTREPDGTSRVEIDLEDGE
jgi:uncharacterized protein with HEPN domain